MRTPKIVFYLFVLLGVVAVFPAFPQSQMTGAHLTGMLTDPSGASVNGARVTAHFESDGTAKVLMTDSGSDGSYSLELAPGRYRIVITKDSFVPRETELTLQSGESRSLSLRMELAPMSSSVLVTGQAAPIGQEQSPAPSSILTSEQI